VVLADHIDDVLREAIVSDELQRLFAERPRAMEYREGVLVEPEAPAARPADGAPAHH
jgi:hypothetical protein